MSEDLMLNPQQQEAVYCEGGTLVLAGAGTGKTRTLIGRIIRLLKEGEDATNILAVTFTNKATKEMQTRVAEAIDNNAPWIGTFHGICHRILRMHVAAANLRPHFQILDTQDQKTFIRRLMREHDIDEKENPIPELIKFISKNKESGQRANNVSINNNRDKQLREFYSLYENACRRDNKVDFAELILATIELWRANKELRTHYAKRFRHILIDEFQDTNKQQFDWLKLLDSGDNCFFAVGDDDQSIYAFRGAEPGIMQRFQSELRAARLIRLEENYRSGKNILAIANHLIAFNSNRFGKKLKTDAANGTPIMLNAAEDDQSEAAEVASEIAQHINNGGKTDDIAVLYRTNAQGRLFEQALKTRNIPYRIYGSLRFHDRMEVRHALAYLWLTASDNIDALRRVINVPPRGIGEKSIAALFADNDPFANLQTPANAKIAKFNQLLSDLRQAATTLPLGELTRLVVEKSGLLAHYEEKQEQERADYLRELVNDTTQFIGESTDNIDILLEFLSTTALSGKEEEETDDSVQTVSLMTVHAAKGLEYNRVFIVGLEEGLFPHEFSLDNPLSVEEERRLMYVAITRARQTLSLHYSKRRMQYGNIHTNPHSRFLDELPQEHIIQPTIKKHKPNTFRLGDLPKQPKHDNVATEQNKGQKSSTLNLGDQVRHPKYGKGVVISRSGGGKEAQVIIFFNQAGQKTFKTALAPLTKL